MLKYEYKVVPAPTRGVKAKGVKGAEAQFAHALAALMNEHGQDGWEYQRSDALPSEERKGLAGRTVTTRYVLVFRREIVERAEYDTMPPLDLTGTDSPRTEPPLRRHSDDDLAAE